MITKVISGGQTGIDQLGLKVAKFLGIPTGGTAPRNYRTELGPYPSLKEKYGLVESEYDDYNVRTKQNVLDSNATVLFGDMTSSGSRTTIAYCVQYNKNCIMNPDIEQLIAFIHIHKVKVLNVAGNRGSKVPTKDLLMYSGILITALKAINNL